MIYAYYIFFKKKNFFYYNRRLGSKGLEGVEEELESLKL